MKPKVIILSGYGLNCEDETSLAFTLAGGRSTIVHINDLIANKKQLENFQILAIPGGFSYGDDTGSGRAYANKLNNHLADALQKFSNADKLILGICNGFQILTQIGLLPGALLHNKQPRYLDRWVDLSFPSLADKVCPWLTGLKNLSLPIAHGEGKFYAPKKDLAIIKKQGQIGAVYAKGEICKLQNLDVNPNGSMLNIAMLTSKNGKILGTMPHPERAIFFPQLPHWTLLKEKLVRASKAIPKFGPGLEIFQNGIKYFA